MSNKKIVMQKITDSIEKASANSKIKPYFQLAKEDLKKLEDQGVEATILNNWKKIEDSAPMADFIKTSNFGPYIPELWPIVTAWYPEFPLKDLISVQGMDMPLAYIAVSKLKTATSKGEVQVGEMVETPTGMRQINGTYPTGEVQGEQLKAADFQFDDADNTNTAALVYYPLTIASGYLDKFMVSITDTNSVTDKWAPDTVVNGVINFKCDGKVSTVIESVTMDIQTGSLVVTQTGDTTSQVSAAEAFYVWDIQYADDDTLPQLVEDITIETMEARPRAIGLKWSVFSEYVKKAQFGIDIREDVTKRVLSVIFQFQTRYILDTMYNFSTEQEVTITVPTANITVESKSQEVIKQLNVAAKKIALNTGRMFGNKLVVGMDMRSWLESLPNTYFTPARYDEKGYESPRVLGEYGPYQVFYDPHRETDKGFMTYKSNSSFYDAAYFLGEFMPVVPSDAIQLGTNVRAAFCSMEGHLYHKSNAVIPLKFVIA